jgi:hypothetical protein
MFLQVCIFPLFPLSHYLTSALLHLNFLSCILYHPQYLYVVPQNSGLLATACLGHVSAMKLHSHIWSIITTPLTRNRLTIQISNKELLYGYLRHLQLGILKRGRKIFQYAGSTGRVLCCWPYQCDVTELGIRHGSGWRVSRSTAM